MLKQIRPLNEKTLKYIDLARAKSESSVFILMIKAMKSKLTTCNFKQKRKKEARGISSPLEGGAK